MKIEFEKKFVLTTAFNPSWVEKRLPKPEIIMLWQAYDGKNNRVRASLSKELTFKNEIKTSLKLGTSYAAQTEEESDISKEQFLEVWNKAKRWLAKVRYSYTGFHNFPEQNVSFGHDMVIDYHILYNKEDINKWEIADIKDRFLVLAEMETMLDNNTINLNLDFKLPLVVRSFLLKDVDKRDKMSKIFSSYNLTPTKENIEKLRTGMGFKK